MATDIELAVFAYQAYAVTANSLASTTPDWIPDAELSGEGEHGFAASVFVSANEVVVSFRGTDSKPQDSWTANIDAGRGDYSSQVQQAIYLVSPMRTSGSCAQDKWCASSSPPIRSSDTECSKAS
jgi:hypothetical protein